MVQQFYTTLLGVVAEQFFEGSVSKLPTYSVVIVASGLMRYVGKIVVHSILQGGPGLSIFSNAVYCYITTRSTENVADAITKDDFSGSVKWYIEKVSQVFYSVFPILHYLGVTLTHMALPDVTSGGGGFLKICSPSLNNVFLWGEGGTKSSSGTHGGGNI